MKLDISFLVAALVTGEAATTPSAACAKFLFEHPNATFFPNQTNYVSENTGKRRFTLSLSFVFLPRFFFMSYLTLLSF
jgi:hypothetical protein